jgi:DNA-binding Lrp family transcriptional regulator
MKAFVFVNVKMGNSPEIVTRLRRLRGVRSANVCWGRPDIIATVETPDGKALSDLVLTEVQLLEGVESTDTHIVIEEAW